ncbi:hypothetical protein AVEN_150553-1 [Araneus ventricosus]|uniref:RNase H type-1 domain-containing protein n=1 Tax=Araneus ventricosus TaxID=182803 RepID=A0A4Y2MFA9_ARAVE|nr:hypothetical protein AVEN_150553-1 [Araneus ventricosus]
MSGSSLDVHAASVVALSPTWSILSFRLLIHKYALERGTRICLNLGLTGNEIADAVAKAGADDAPVPSAPLTYLELFSRAKSRNKTMWPILPVHHWYQGSPPGGCLSIDCSRRDQTTLTCFLSGHIRSLTFSDNSKCFEICPKCTAEQATPDHILACLGLSKQDLVSNPLLTLDFFRVHRLMDLI